MDPPKHWDELRSLRWVCSSHFLYSIHHVTTSGSG